MVLYIVHLMPVNSLLYGLELDIPMRMILSTVVIKSIEEAQELAVLASS